MALIAQTLEDLPEQPTRYHVLEVLRYELENTLETAHLIDYIQDMWETIDLLIQRFGREAAQKIMATPAPLWFICPTSEEGA